jgi:thiol:disulfide interchange protein
VFFLIAAAATGLAQQPPKNDPVQWTLEAEPASVVPGGRVLLKFKAKIEAGWHLYAPTTSKGPVPTKITLAETAPVTLRQLHQPAPIVKRDEAFDNDQEYFEKEVVFLIEADLPASAAAGDLQVVAQARYQACSGTLCLRTKTKTASVALRADPGARAAAPAIPAGYAVVSIAASAAAAATAAPTKMGGAGQSEDLGRFLLLAFGFGLAAIFTPCVFPMIPFVMSDFLNRKNALGQAALFCGGIIVSFTALGLALTAALGPFGVVQLGSNPWVNAFIFSIFVVFGFSMLGAFEIMLPSGLVNKANEASQGGGGSIRSMLMGLTFSLTSFACVGPFVGTLLAASVQGGGARPLLGMATFAAGLATPFFFLAVFPSLLQKLPKSGGWLPRVKTVMGFVILAAALKYLSNIDQVLQWGFLTRERFLAAWIVLFAMPGLYLLGFLRMEGIKADATLGVARTLIGAAFLIFAVSLWPGMSCQRLGEIDAYIPACAEGALSGGGGAAVASGGSAKWAKNDYRGAIARAKAEGKTVLVAFTGYACTNCHWMKANMFTRPEVAEALQKFVLVELYTDGTDAASEENQKLQEGKFATVAIPHYAIVDGEEKIAASFAGLTKDPAQFLKFLESGKAVAAL